MCLDLDTAVSTSPDLTVGINASGGECTCELNGALGGSPSSEVLKRGGLHLVVTDVVPVGGGADKKRRRVLVLFSI